MKQNATKRTLLMPCVAVLACTVGTAAHAEEAGQTTGQRYDDSLVEELVKDSGLVLGYATSAWGNSTYDYDGAAGGRRNLTSVGHIDGSVWALGPQTAIWSTDETATRNVWGARLDGDLVLHGNLVATCNQDVGAQETAYCPVFETYDTFASASADYNGQVNINGNIAGSIKWSPTLSAGYNPNETYVSVSAFPTVDLDLKVADLRCSGIGAVSANCNGDVTIFSAKSFVGGGLAFQYTRDGRCNLYAASDVGSADVTYLTGYVHVHGEGPLGIGATDKDKTLQGKRYNADAPADISQTSIACD